MEEWLFIGQTVQVSHHYWVRDKEKGLIGVVLDRKESQPVLRESPLVYLVWLSTGEAHSYFRCDLDLVGEPQM